jgi:hypothetical protein
MPFGRLIFFAIWLVLAMVAGALIVLAWERLRSKYAAPESPAQPTGKAALPLDR